MANATAGGGKATAKTLAKTLTVKKPTQAQLNAARTKGIAQAAGQRAHVTTVAGSAQAKKVMKGVAAQGKITGVGPKGRAQIQGATAYAKAASGSGTGHNSRGYSTKSK